MAIPSFRAVGTPVYTANSVANPTNLAPTKNASTVNGDLMVLITASRSITATVATPSNWNLVSGFPKASATASGGKIYAFTRIADGSASDAPTVTWTGLTTGTSGDSCSARILSFQNGTTTADGTPPAANDAASTTSITIPAHTTSLAQSLVIGAAIRINDTAHTFTVATFTERQDGHTTSGTGHGTVVASKINATAGSSGTATVTPSNTTSSRTLAVSFGLKAAPTTVTLNQATDTETAGTFTDRKVKTLGQASETNTAQAITPVFVSATVVDLLQASETNTAQPLGRQKIRALGQATDTETAQALTRRKVEPLGQATETDTAQTITPATNAPTILGQASETSTAQPLAARKLKALGQASEADTAQPVAIRKLRGLALVSESDTAQPITRAKRATLTLVSETDTAQPLASRKARTLGLASEADTAQKITVVRLSIYPDPADVRAGVVYGPGGIYTGTLTATGTANLIFARRR